MTFPFGAFRHRCDSPLQVLISEVNFGVRASWCDSPLQVLIQFFVCFVFAEECSSSFFLSFVFTVRYFGPKVFFNFHYLSSTNERGNSSVFLYLGGSDSILFNSD